MESIIQPIVDEYQKETRDSKNQEPVLVETAPGVGGWVGGEGKQPVG